MAKEVQIAVKEIRRSEPDLRKLARALIQLALQEETKITVETPRERSA
jgi:hypothetical protein